MVYTNVQGTINIHGHTHSPQKLDRNFINVCTSAWDYTPVALEELLFEHKQNRRR
jgi:calcineurin-like phosphoesterase family protein